MNDRGQSPLIESLTEREEDVLKLLAEGKTNRQIAEELVLSVNTVKWYNRQIYGKLQVAGREEAAARARDLALLASDQVAERPTYNLPRPAMPLLGRERELEELESLLLDSRTRIISIIGPGGMGKTRLALEMALKWNGRFADGASFVSLAPLQSEESIVPAMAQSLRFTFRAGSQDEKTQLINFLHGKELLLVLDNFEHLIGSAPMLAEMVKAAPKLKIVATSREKLNLRIEQLYPLQSLSLSDWQTVEQAKEDPAVRLFLEYGLRVRPNFELQTEDLEALRQMLQLVEGMPLAIILASAWLELLTPAEIATEIEKNIDFLEAAYQDLPERQRSMRAVFDASWKQLNDEQQKVFSALSVFRGGFTLDAARKAVGATPEILLGLVSRSLLSRNENGRFEIHALLRQFAADKLTETREFGATRSSHSAYYLDLLCRLGEDVKGGEHQLKALETIGADIENIRLAWRWAIDNQVYDRLREAVPILALVLRYCARVEEGERLFRQAADILNSRNDEDSKRLSGQVMARQAGFVASQLGYGASLDLLQRSLEIARRAGAQAEIAYCLGEMGNALLRGGDPHRAKPVLEESLEIALSIGDRHTQIQALIALHDILILEGEHVQAVPLARQLLALCRETGDKHSLGDAIYRLGVNSAYLGEYEEAKRYLEESLVIGRQLDDPDYISTSQSALALYATRVQGAYGEARALAEQSLALARSINNPGSMSRALIALGDVACWKERYSEALRRAEESLQIITPRGDTELIHFGRNVLSLALCGLGAYGDAQRVICEALRLTGFHTPEALLLFHLAGMALVLAGEGDDERAIELYALAASHAHPSAWLEKLPLHVNARDALQAKVPPDIFERAWKRGEERDLKEALSGVLSKYCL